MPKDNDTHSERTEIIEHKIKYKNLRRLPNPLFLLVWD